jgi:hypothetical protein
LGLVYIALKSVPDLDKEKYDQVMLHWPLDRGPEFASHLSTWDGAHYLLLSSQGYAAGLKSCAFYPLWPLLIRWSSILFGGNHLIAGIALANLLSVMAWTAFYHITATRFGEVVARRALVLLVVFPGALFYQGIYSESLFFLLVMLMWCGLEWGWLRVAWWAAFFLPLVRGVGVFGLLPIVWYCVTKQPWCWFDRQGKCEIEFREAGAGSSLWRNLVPIPAVLKNATIVSEGSSNRSSRKMWRMNMSLMAAPLLGWSTYLGLMWLWTGNQFEGIQAQRHWGVHSISNLWNIPKIVLGYCQPSAWHDFQGSILDRAAFALLAASLPLIWHVGRDLLPWVCMLGILPAMSGTFTSYIRYEATVFPLFLGLAIFFTRLKNVWPIRVFVFGSAVLHTVLLWRFINFRWAG